MKSLTTLWQEAAKELATWCGTSTSRDCKTVRDRVEAEGISFLTITLPTFGEDLEKGLTQGYVGDDQFAGFRRTGGLPAFLRGFLRQVFDETTGVLLDTPSTEAIFAIRQLTLMMKKIELECAPVRKRRARAKFIQCEEELKALDKSWTEVDHSRFRRISAIMFGDVFDAVNREIDVFELDPRHGPGATADRKVGNQKFEQTEWPARLEQVFPYGEYVSPSWRHYQPDRLNFLCPGDERPVKVKFVPKTLKTPRVIAVEPTAMQYMQQALLKSLVPKLESSTNSRDFVGFTYQEPNRLMAREGSITGDLATLDLSEASDRVLNSAVLEMLKPWPSLSEAVQACRTRVAELEDGQRIRLSKFASMGSALCFPFEAMVFCTLVMMGVEDAWNIRITQRSLERLRGRVRVYGDDIVVPTDCAMDVVRHLTDYGLVVNTSKSFLSGKFRESCGGDFYDGEDVKPIRVSQKPPLHRRDAKELIAWTMLSNTLHQRGMWKTAQHAREQVEKVLGPLRCVPMSSNALGLHSYTGTKPERWDPKLHRYLVSTWKAHAPIPANGIDGIAALRKTLGGDWSDPAYRKHLLHSGRPLAVHIKRGWEPASL